jgi:GNAT superfamily N-acetyltransferase
LSFGSSDSLAVRESTSSDRQDIRKLSDHFRHAPSVTLFDKTYDIAELPGYVANANSHMAGVLSYAVEDDALVIASMDVLPGYQGLGAGMMLVEAAKAKAAAEGRKIVRAAVSNDDLPAMYFYQRNGFRVYDVKPNLVAARHEEPEVGFGGIPARDEIRLQWEKA